MCLCGLRDYYHLYGRKYNLKWPAYIYKKFSLTLKFSLSFLSQISFPSILSIIYLTCAVGLM